MSALPPDIARAFVSTDLEKHALRLELDRDPVEDVDAALHLVGRLKVLVVLEEGEAGRYDTLVAPFLCENARQGSVGRTASRHSWNGGAHLLELSEFEEVILVARDVLLDIVVLLVLVAVAICSQGKP